MENNFVEICIKKFGLPMVVEFSSEEEGKKIMDSVVSKYPNVSSLEDSGYVLIYDKTVMPEPTPKDFILYTFSEMEKSKQRKLTDQEVKDYCEKLISDTHSISEGQKSAASEILANLKKNKLTM